MESKRMDFDKALELAKECSEHARREIAKVEDSAKHGNFYWYTFAIDGVVYDYGFDGEEWIKGDYGRGSVYTVEFVDILR